MVPEARLDPTEHGLVPGPAGVQPTPDRDGRLTGDDR